MAGAAVGTTCARELEGVGPSRTGADEEPIHPDGSHPLGGGANGFRARARTLRRRTIPAIAIELRDHIDSLELIQLRAQAGREWTAAELSAELRTTPASVMRRLESLEQRGLAVRNAADGFGFASADAATVDQLAACYATRRVAVIEAIFSGEDAAVMGGDGLEPPTPWV